MNLVLVEPEIPQNTGNIARTCVLTGTALHLVKPLGFSLDDRYLKRAGLDYWPYLDLHLYENFAELEEKHTGGRFFLATTRGREYYHRVSYRQGDFIILGRETLGLDPGLIERYRDTTLRIPMTGPPRSLNLANSAAIILYEALRQLGFPGLQ